MYTNQDEINNPTFLTHNGPLPDANSVKASDEENRDDASTDDEDADPAHITTVPFSTTKVGSFQ